MRGFNVCKAPILSPGTLYPGKPCQNVIFLVFIGACSGGKRKNISGAQLLKRRKGTKGLDPDRSIGISIVSKHVKLPNTLGARMDLTLGCKGRGYATLWLINQTDSYAHGPSSCQHST